jgi:hypothetical protein
LYCEKKARWQGGKEENTIRRPSRKKFLKLASLRRPFKGLWKVLRLVSTRRHGGGQQVNISWDQSGI